jgi:transposase
VRVDQLVFIDEFGAATNMTRSRARSHRGKRVVCHTPCGHWKVLSTIAAMTTRGMVCCGTFDGATDTDTFVGFITELAKVIEPGQVVVMDNLSAHRSGQIDDLIESSGGYVLRLPPYSPDLNPIEMAISKVKSLLKKAERRTVETLQPMIATALTSVTPSDALGYITHCGYADRRK